MSLTRAQFWKAALVGVVFAGATFVGIQVGQAATSTSSVVRACVNKKTFAVRMPTSGKCRSTERTVSWNAKGDRGARGPAGAVTVNGGKYTETQYIGYNGESWTCVDVPVSAFLHSDGSSSSFTKLNAGFKAFSANVAADTGCNKETCVIRLYDVTDHNTCTVTFRGGAFATESEVLPSDNNLLVDFGSAWTPGQEVTISIACLR